MSKSYDIEIMIKDIVNNYPEVEGIMIRFAMVKVLYKLELFARSEEN